MQFFLVVNMKNIFLYLFLLIEFNIKWIFEYWVFCFKFLLFCFKFLMLLRSNSTFVFLNIYYKCRFKHFRINKFPSKLLFANFSRILLCIIYNLVRKFSLREKREQDATPWKFLPKRHKNLPPKRILSKEKKKKVSDMSKGIYRLLFLPRFFFVFFSFLMKEKKNFWYIYIKDAFSLLFLLCYLFSFFFYVFYLFFLFNIKHM